MSGAVQQRRADAPPGAAAAATPACWPRPAVSPSLPQLLLARLSHPIPVYQLFCLMRCGMSAGRHRPPMLPCWCHPVVSLLCRIHCSGQPGPPNWQGLSGRLCSQLWCRGCDKPNGRDSHTVRLLFSCRDAPAGHTAVGTHAAAGEPTVPHSPPRAHAHRRLELQGELARGGTQLYHGAVQGAPLLSFLPEGGLCGADIWKEGDGWQR